MAPREADSEFNSSLHYFQVRQLFNPKDLERVLSQPIWERTYPKTIQEWRSEDELTRERVLVPFEILQAIVQSCTCLFDIYFDRNRQTMYAVPCGGKPFRIQRNADNLLYAEEIDGLVAVSVECALREFGADALWLAQEYGSSRRGEQDNRFRIAESKEAS